MGITYTDNVTMLNAVGSTTTSSAYDISKRQLVTIQFITAGGTSVFTVDVSNDGVNWITSIAFLDSTQTAVGTYIASKSLASATSGAVVISGFRFIRVVATWTSGTASAILQAAG